MDVLRFLSIVYKAYDGVSSLVHEGASVKEKYNGIIIESYYGIFCSSIITRFGRIRILDSGCDKPNQDYIPSRITYKKIIELNSCTKTGCVGPFYLVTHIDGIPIEHDNVDGITYNTFYNYVTYTPFSLENVSEFPGYITDCIQRGFIKDTLGIIDKVLVDPEYYPTAVLELIEPLANKHYHGVLDKNIYYHIFTLLYQRQLLIF
jgi:hypothetical protein